MDHVVAASAGYKLPNVVRNGGGQGFSPSDMTAGPGYVVVKGGRVLHQRGPRTVRRVK